MLSDVILNDNREATNKVWVLGSGRFNARVEKQLERRIAPKARGGDRKSKAYHKMRKSIESDLFE